MSNFMLELVLGEVLLASQAHRILDVDMACTRISALCLAYGDTSEDIRLALTELAVIQNGGILPVVA
ncbi:hypothetical protein [Kaistia terrae]|uniref:Uncharacterized protein n=1 Tax=Kaistia terrae TaxID=537017 RepID=A0ABW0PRS5_9HYPH|nr:hypothetical protein [Kaistia terrae]MCX5580230.1 hypothetical protein [Kaistia terrae]